METHSPLRLAVHCSRLEMVPMGEFCSHSKPEQNSLSLSIGSRFSPEYLVLLIILLSSLSSFPAVAASTGEVSSTENVLKMCLLLFFYHKQTFFFFLNSFLLSAFNFGKQHIKVLSVPLLCRSLPHISLSCLCLFISCLN